MCQHVLACYPTLSALCVAALTVVVTATTNAWPNKQRPPSVRRQLRQWLAEKTGSALLRIDGSERDRRVRETDVSERQTCQGDRGVRETDRHVRETGVSDRQRGQSDRQVRERDSYVRETDGSEKQRGQRERGRWVRERDRQTGQGDRQTSQRDRHVRETDRWVRERDGSASAVWLSDDIIT